MANFEDDDFAALQGLTLSEMKKVLQKDFVRVPRCEVVAVPETSLTIACYIELLTVFLVSILKTVQRVDVGSWVSSPLESSERGPQCTVPAFDKLAEAIASSCLEVSMDEAMSIVVPTLAFHDLLP